MAESDIKGRAPAAQMEPQPAKIRPARALPTDRITFAKQLELLRAYVVASQAGGGKGVGAKEVSRVLKMSPTTPPLASRFFLEAGLILKVEGGYCPGPDVISYHRACSLDPSTAGSKLAPTLRQSWFAGALLSRLAVREMTEAVAIGELAEEAKADGQYKSQLRVLLEFLEAAGLIQRDGEIIRASGMDFHATPTNLMTMPEGPGGPDLGRVTTAGLSTLAGNPAGTIEMGVSIRVDMKELAEWTPDRISAFFSGLAQVLAAKGKVGA